ncbi:hypothetical protein JCM3770_006106 [Rhodotorula araucariae]
MPGFSGQDIAAFRAASFSHWTLEYVQGEMQILDNDWAAIANSELPQECRRALVRIALADRPNQPAPDQAKSEAGEDLKTRLKNCLQAFFPAARALVPASTRRDALRAWDRTRGVRVGARSPLIGAGVLSNARAQAALHAVVDLVDTSAASVSSIRRKRPASPAASVSSIRRERPASPDASDRLLRASSPSTPPLHNRKRTRTRTLAARKQDGKQDGKGKAVLVLDSESDALSDSNDALVVVEADSSFEVLSPPPAAPRSWGRGKGKECEVLLLDDSDASFELPPEQAAPPSPLAQVVAILPDVLPSYAAELLAAPEHAQGGVTSVVEALLALGKYPRINDDNDKEREKEKEVDWLDVDARKKAGEVPSVLYKKIALDQLYTDFDRLPTALIKQSFLSAAHSTFFAPTWSALHSQQTAGALDAQKLKKARKAPKPVVRIVRRQRINANGEVEEWDAEEEERPPAELRREMSWLRGKILAERAARRAADEDERAAERERQRAERANERARATGQGVECGCCYDEVALINTAACSEGHLFCKGCALSNASDRIGRRQAVLPCMAADCTARFVPAMYASFLVPKMVDSLSALAQQKDLDEAFHGVEGFEKCPFCPYACLVENPDERLFRCERPECRKVTCRKCRKEGHVPLSCEEADDERRLPGVHAIAEAMSAALIRPCPKCNVPCLKQDGCSKMVCAQCNAYWCYVCREIISGYAHFQQKRADGSTCPLHDDTEMSDYNQVEQARLRAQEALDARTAADAARRAPSRGQACPRSLPLPIGPVEPLAIGADNPTVDQHGQQYPHLSLEVQNAL